MKIHKETEQQFHNYLFIFGIIGLVISIASWSLLPILILIMMPVPLAIAYEIGRRMRYKKKETKKKEK